MPQVFLLLVVLCATTDFNKRDCEVVYTRSVMAESQDACVALAIYQLRFFQGTTMLPYKYTACMMIGGKVA